MCSGFVSKLARRLPRHNGYRTFNAQATLATIHPSSVLGVGEDPEGLLPEWVLYQELVSTTKPFLRTVSALEHGMVERLLPRLRGVDAERLSGGATGAAAAARAAAAAKAAAQGDGGAGAGAGAGAGPAGSELRAAAEVPAVGAAAGDKRKREELEAQKLQLARDKFLARKKAGAGRG